MDFSKLSSINFEPGATNSTLTSLPSTLLEALIPGYGIVSQIIRRTLGFDVGLVVSGCLVVFGLFQGAQLLYYKSYSFFASYLLSSIQIEDDDALFSQIMQWIAEQRMTKVSRDLKAVSKWISSYEDSDDDDIEADEDILDETGLFNYEKWASKVPPRYEPNYGDNRFWYGGRMFMFSRTRRETKRNMWADEGQVLVISCMGRGTDPIKELLSHIKSWNLTKENKMTSVYRPVNKDWERQSTRPSRPMSTVSLDRQQKAKIVTDINEYLHPASARWYASRGIPYRRGYLFYGPPGTGKTSLSFALAGIFGLNIYCISLMQAGLTESDLNTLFGELPRRCIVLLEDIDAAGLRRPEDPLPEPKDDPDASNAAVIVEGPDGEPVTVSKADGMPKPPGSQPPAATATRSLISLSGLLNTIDGAASHEGRVLIMTTNHAEQLDAALIRPGRVDLQVQFTLATHDQTRDIFKRMYSTTPSEQLAKVPSTPTKATSPAPKRLSLTQARSKSVSPNVLFNDDADDAAFLELLARPPALDVVLEPEKLRVMADEFAAQIPEKQFSPAEIQGFLLTRKKEPRRAVEEVAGWVAGVLEGREKGTKVLGGGVQ
ncbi:BCS1 N terminal-domain-containing protein [Massariosphaeria phaeospora]|uniref:BCS1 N terminal-domain-containing protein n=1 Tax=Massariosphaeria phaeospora TaxID=100035 RepID=A0A7C8I1R9_9PLEO|nr:BCS1 N terminal-domain-containing protein [Massariosphaeria phaeospora]